MVEFRKLEQNSAQTIANWYFPDDYQWTTLGKHSENEYYLLNEDLRNNNYYQITGDGQLKGYFSINNEIRQEYGALQLVLKPEFCNERFEMEVINNITDFIRQIRDCNYVNVMAYSTQPHAIKVYEKCGFENKGELSGQGHEMAAYEQEGFDVDESGKKIEEIKLTVLSKKIR